ncbi:MAG TPA: DUF2911 domain-containing protein [Gemmatimonadales bacterium]|nr:DUF2911 domain-containing protein [Gemmatimonadales bacterium]
MLLLRCAFLASATVLIALPAPGQIMASERATVSQVIDGTTISLDYARPRLRGRQPDSLFNGWWIPTGEVWTPGANDATLLRVSKDVTINGVAVPAGAYSMWMVVDTAEQWLTALKTDTTLFHMPFPTVDAEDIQFRTPMRLGEATDALIWTFDTPRSTGVTAELRWANRVGTLDIAVEPSLPMAFPAGAAGKFAGEYEVTWAMADEEAPEDLDTSLVIFHRDGMLRAEWDLFFYPITDQQILIPLTDEWFTLGMEVDGELFEVQKWMTFEFQFADGKATGFEVRLESDKVMLRGTRKQGTG